MIEIKVKNFKNNRREWWLFEEGKEVIGFDKLSDLKEHFKESLSIDTRTKKVEVKSEDKFLQDIIFIWDVKRLDSSNKITD